MSANILVIGKSGQLAHALAALKVRDMSLVCVEPPEFDLTATKHIAQSLAALSPAGVINAAAYTAVDRAETNQNAAFALNRDGPAALAQACAQRAIPLVHVSTDYVFDGEKPAPYVETDSKSPQSIYGRSKSEGEDAILASGAHAAILRTAWLYDATGANFVRTMLRLAEERDEISVVADQLGRPTWAPDLAQACVTAIGALLDGETKASGVFHYSGLGDATWADLAEAALAEHAKRGGKSARIKRITTADYPTPARRPKNSRLDCAKIENALGLRMRPWLKALSLCMDEIHLR
jgi:dTDP-4-dehydrorhamnose reductase